MPFSSGMIWPGTNSALRLPQKIILSHLDSDSTKLEHMICIRLILGITESPKGVINFISTHQSIHFGFPSAHAPRDSASLLSQSSSSPVAHPHPSSIHTSRWTSSPCEPPP